VGPILAPLRGLSFVRETACTGLGGSKQTIQCRGGCLYAIECGGDTNVEQSEKGDLRLEIAFLQ
jgi:hypothetical protein